MYNLGIIEARYWSRNVTAYQQ